MQKVKDICGELGYRGCSGVLKVLEQLFPEKKFLETDKLTKNEHFSLLSELSKPQQGRSAELQNRAKELLQTFGEDVLKVFKQPSPDVLEVSPMPADNFSATPEIFKTPENIPLVPPQTFWGKAQSLLAMFGMFLIYPPNLVYLFVMGMAFYAVCDLLGWIGFCGGVIYAGVGIHALIVAGDSKKQDTAREAFIAVVVMELVAFAVEIPLFNKRLWESARAGKMEVFAHYEQAIFWTAVAFAALFSLAGMYVVSIKMSSTREADWYEKFG